MKTIRHTIWILLMLSGMTACNPEKEIYIDLPPYESQIYVECYLEPGKNYQLALYESVSYFEVPPLPDITSAIVTITHNGVTDTLKYQPYMDPITEKFYNYVCDPAVVCPLDYNDFYLKIVDSAGRTVTGTARFPRPIAIDQIKFKYNEDSVAYAETTFTDDQSERNFYRYQITLDNMVGRPRTDRLFDNTYLNGNTIKIESGYNLDNHTPVIITLYRLSEDYFTFLQSVDDANNANGNPFAQPAQLKSTVTGGLGVFTALTYDRRVTIVEP